jgi:hypothetical protein
MIRKGGNRFFSSGQTRSVCPEIMLEQEDKARVWFDAVESDAGAGRE